MPSEIDNAEEIFKALNLPRVYCTLIYQSFSFMHKIQNLCDLIINVCNSRFDDFPDGPEEVCATN